VRSLVSLITVGLCLVGCTSSSVHPTPPSAERSPIVATPVAPPSPVELPEIVLTARLSERPTPWRRVVFLPFGGSRERLGYKTFPDGPASQPSSFALASDGTIWVADRWKYRIVHCAMDGRYLGSVDIDVGRGRIQDMVALGSALYVSTRYQFGQLWKVDPAGTVTSVRVHDRQDSIVVEEIAATPGFTRTVAEKVLEGL